VTPLSAERCAFQFTGRKSAYGKLRYIQALLGHAVPSGDIGEVFERGMDALIEKLEKQKFAATTRPGRPRSSVNPRHIPAHVKRAVWERDGAQCTFVGDAGQRRPARTPLEFDHVDPVARGGEATGGCGSSDSRWTRRAGRPRSARAGPTLRSSSESAKRSAT